MWHPIFNSYALNFDLCVLVAKSGKCFGVFYSWYLYKTDAFGSKIQKSITNRFPAQEMPDLLRTKRLISCAGNFFSTAGNYIFLLR
jgi:hypothetical protein